MIRNISLLLMALTSVIASGQKSIEIPGNQRDTLFYEGLVGDLAQYGLEDLTKTQDSLYLRIWHSNEIIEVKRREKSSHTTLTNWIRKIEKKEILNGVWDISIDEDKRVVHFKILKKEFHKIIDAGN